MNSTKFLTTEERERLESFLKARIDTDTRNVALILTALHSGARASELLALTWSNIDLKSGACKIQTIKQKANKLGIKPIVWREVALPSHVRKALTLLKAQSPEKPFKLSYSRLAEVWNMYRPNGKVFHSLRHTFAMRCYEKTKDIRFVQKSLGHVSITNTQIYTDCDYSANEFKKLMGVR
jgi:integrase